MVTTRIHPSLTAKFIQSPETGMGYQILEASLKPDLPSYVLIVNAELAIERKEHRIFLAEALAEAVAVMAEGRILKALCETPEKVDFRVLSRSEALAKGLIEMRAGKAEEGPAIEASPQMSAAAEKFLRYSAFANDRRINFSDGSVKPGTYTTTYDDGTAYIKTGMDAVRRYALPNPAPAVNKFELKPPTQIQVRRGTVSPAYGQPGGGKEVIFDNGAPANTFQLRSTIPPLP